jgi:phosphoglycolate phosphatase-like HAD superfamily hydrolase
MIKLIAFDWNGTLLADTQTVVDATSIELGRLYKRTVDIQEYRREFIIPVRNFFINLGISAKELDKNYKKSAHIFDTEYEKRVWRCRTRSGTRKLLKWLKDQHIKSVIFSNHATERVKQQTDRLKITGYFERILANDLIRDAYSIKGKEKKLIDYLRKEKIKNGEVLVIGDTDEEIIIGRDMGAKTAAITNGHSTTTRLRTAKPDYLINNLQEVIGIVKKLNF